MRHKLLLRQLKKLSANGGVLDENHPAWQEFINDIDKAYKAFDDDLKMLEHSMEISSTELIEANREMRKQNTEIEAIYRIAMTVHNTESFEQMYQLVLGKVSETLKFPIATLEIYDRGSNSVHLESQIGFPADIMGKQTYPASHSPMGQYLGLSQEMTMKEPSPWHRVAFKTLISVPLLRDSEVVGVFSVAHPMEDQSSLKTVQWLTAVATQISDALTRKQLNEAMRGQELQMIAASKMSELGRMAGGIAHEINTPLATISLIVGYLEKCLDKNSLEPETLKKQLRQIESTVFRIAKIITGLRTFSRDGRQDPFIDCEAAQIVQDTLTLCNEKFKLMDVELRVNLTPDLNLKCRAVQVTQVLLNLLNNAADAVGNLPEKWVQIETQMKNDRLEFVITDSGKGISSQDQERLFQPFFTTKSIGEGTGLGLSVSLGIAKAHRGSIQYDNTCANTRFVLSLPLDPDKISVQKAA